MTTQTERKPFHESIVDAIKKTTSPSALMALADLVVETKAPKDHQAIYEALAAQATALGMVGEVHINRAMLALSEQVKEAQEKSAKVADEPAEIEVIGYGRDAQKLRPGDVLEITDIFSWCPNVGGAPYGEHTRYAATLKRP